MNQDTVVGSDHPNSKRWLQVLFWCAVTWAVATIWIAPRPPLIDMPQHAGQIAALYEMATGDFRWSELVRLNFFTPYLLGYGSGFLLAFLMPVTAVIKTLITLAFLGYLAACLWLRRLFVGRPELDWLFIPGFFGFAYKWGFLTFLLAASVGLMFVGAAQLHARSNSWKSAGLLVLLGLLTFFCHGVVFAFSCVAGVLLTLRQASSFKGLLKGLLPYAAFAALAVFYAWSSASQEAAVNPYAGQGGRGSDAKRILGFLVYILGEGKSDLILLPASLTLLAAPWLLGFRMDWGRTACVLGLSLILAWVVFPDSAMESGFLYQRFAIFTLPFYAFAFASSPMRAKHRTLLWHRIGLGAVLVATSYFLVIQTSRAVAFRSESQDFEPVLAAAQPGERLFALVDYHHSAGAQNDGAYAQWPSWYQAEKGGWVDGNFAAFRAQVVRYRPNKRLDFEIFAKDGRLDWGSKNGIEYRYVLARSRHPLKLEAPRAGYCQARLVKVSGDWQLYERQACL